MLLQGLESGRREEKEKKERKERECGRRRKQKQKRAVGIHRSGVRMSLLVIIIRALPLVIYSPGNQVLLPADLYLNQPQMLGLKIRPCRHLGIEVGLLILWILAEYVLIQLQVDLMTPHVHCLLCFVLVPFASCYHFFSLTNMTSVLSDPLFLVSICPD